jgi:hypothetical protein
MSNRSKLQYRIAPDGSRYRTGASAKKGPSSLLVILVSLAIIFVIGILCVLLLVKSRETHDPEQSSQNVAVKTTDELRLKLAKTSFPTYASRVLPSGYDLQQDSLVTNDTFASFTIAKKDGTQLTITEQPRPELVEEVTHTQELQSPLGNAFIANLNGRYAGFLYTSKTLLIVTGSSVNSTISADIASYIISLEAL